MNWYRDLLSGWICNGMCSKAEGAPVGFGSHFAQDLSSLNDKLIDSKIPSESGDQGESKLGQNEL